MLFEKVVPYNSGIRIQEYTKCMLFGYNGYFIQEEDIYSEGTLMHIDCISVLKTKNYLEVAKFANGTFNIELNLPIAKFADLDKSLISARGMKYRLIRQISENCTQYLYIYHHGSLNI